jgi:hypothetical protein
MQIVFLFWDITLRECVDEFFKVKFEQAPAFKDFKALIERLSVNQHSLAYQNYFRK